MKKHLICLLSGLVNLSFGAFAANFETSIKPFPFAARPAQGTAADCSYMNTPITEICGFLLERMVTCMRLVNGFEFLEQIFPAFLQLKMQSIGQRQLQLRAITVFVFIIQILTGRNVFSCTIKTGRLPNLMKELLKDSTSFFMN